MPEFIYDADIPTVIVPVIQRSIEPWAWVVPVWCERVFVGYSAESSGNNESAACYVEYPYRWARLTFYPCFLKQDNLSLDGLHELVHIPVAVLSMWMKERIRTMVKEEDAPIFRKVLLDELTERTEAATQDLTSRIYARVKLAIEPATD